MHRLGWSLNVTIGNQYASPHLLRYSVSPPTVMKRRSTPGGRSRLSLDRTITEILSEMPLVGAATLLQEFLPHKPAREPAVVE